MTTDPEQAISATRRLRVPPGLFGWGIVLSASVAVLSMIVNAWVPLASALLLALIVGAVLRNVGLIPEAAEPGRAESLALRLGVVLLGLRLSIPQVLDLGGGVVVVILATVIGTYLIVLLSGRMLGVTRATTVLIATGCAICGAAAVAAVSSVLPKRDDDEENVGEAAATAIATVTLFGTVALVAVPVLAGLMNLGDMGTGVWIGSSVHEVGQVVAGAGIAGGGVMAFAVVTKLGRVVLLAPLVAAVAWWEGRHSGNVGDSRPSIIPWFVVGFLILVGIRSLATVPDAILRPVDLAAVFLLTIGMFGMGAAVRIRRLIETGARALVLGSVAAVVSAVISLTAVLLFVV